MSIADKGIAKHDYMWVGCLVYSSRIISKSDLDLEHQKRISRLPRVCVKDKYVGKL